MANGQIDIIVSKKAIEEIDLTNKKLDETNENIIAISKSVRELNTNFASVKTPKDLEVRLKDNAKAQKEVNEAAKESARLNKALIVSREKLKTATSDENIELQQNRKRLNEANRAARVLDSAYEKLSKRTLDAKKRAKDLGAQYGITSKQFIKAQKEAQKLDGRIKKLDKAVGDSQRNVGNYPKVFGSATTALKGFIGAFGIIEGLRLGSRFIGELSDLAIQMEGESRRAAIVFGETLAFVTTEAQKNANQLGLTRREYVSAAAATQDLLIPLGFQRKEASRLSVELTNLSGVLSNWVAGEKSAAEVSEILTKSILGETEQIKQLGIKVDQSSKAFNQRVKTLQETNNLTKEQAKALEILTQITEKSADAQAEFAKETKSLAQQEAIANAEFREQSEILAKDLTPAIIGWTKAKTAAARVTGDLAVVLASELDFTEKLAALGNLVSLGGTSRNAVTAASLRIEQNRLIVAEQAFRILSKTTDKEAARTLVNNLNIDQLNELIESQSVLNDENSESVKTLKKSEDFLKGSIGFIQKIISENDKLIKQATDNKTRTKLREENALLKTQLELLTKVRGLVTPISTTIQQDQPKLAATTPTNFSTATNFDLALADVNNFVDTYRSQLQQAEAITNSFFDNRIERIQQDIDKNNEFFANQIALAEGNEAEQVRLEKERQLRDAELQKKKRKEQERQAIFNKAISVTETIINTATAVTKALPNIPLAVATGVLGAAQLATIIAQPIPKFKDGTDDAPSGLAIVGDGGKHEYIEDSKGNIMKTPKTDTLVDLGNGGQKIHKDLESLQESKGYDLQAINNAAVMSSIYNDGLRLNTLQLKDAFNDALDKYQGRIQKEIKQGLKGFKSNTTVNVNTEHLRYISDTL